jgi:hypothetical protein
VVQCWCLLREFTGDLKYLTDKYQSWLVTSETKHSNSSLLSKNYPVELLQQKQVSLKEVTYHRHIIPLEPFLWTGLDFLPEIILGDKMIGSGG